MTISGDTTVEAAQVTRAPRALVASVIAGVILIAGGLAAAIALNQPPLDPRTVAAPAGFAATEADWGCIATPTSACWTSAQGPSELREQVNAWVDADAVLVENDQRFVVCGWLNGERVQVGVDRRVVNAVDNGGGSFVVPPGVKPVRDGSVMSAYTGGDLGC